MNASHREQMCLLRCMCCTNWYLFLLRAQHWIHGVVYLSKPNGKIIVRAHVCASSTVVTVTTTGAWNTKNCKNPLLYHICSLANDFAVSSFDWLKIAYFNFNFRIIAMANFFYCSINCLRFGFRAISQFYAMEFIWKQIYLLSVMQIISNSMNTWFLTVVLRVSSLLFVCSNRGEDLK